MNHQMMTVTIDEAVVAEIQAALTGITPEAKAILSRAARIALCASFDAGQSYEWAGQLNIALMDRHAPTVKFHKIGEPASVSDNRMVELFGGQS